MQYMLPRLRGWGQSLSRQMGGGKGGGLATRGPGETKIETDRRRIREKMAKMRREIADMKTGREIKRQERRRNKVPSVAIAGYTNAGKSSLLNRLTGAGVLVQNELFATLDPTVRRAETPSGRIYTLADTVGFVRHLPHHLVEAFRSTMEEVGDSDLILHVVDGSHPAPEEQLAAVREVVRDVGATKVPEIVVINKADAADPLVLQRLMRNEKRSIAVSARTGQGIDELLALIDVELPRPSVEIEVLVPYTLGRLVARAHSEGEVISEEHTPEGTLLKVRVHEELAAELAPYVPVPAGLISVCDRMTAKARPLWQGAGLRRMRGADAVGVAPAGVRAPTWRRTPCSCCRRASRRPGPAAVPRARCCRPGRSRCSRRARSCRRRPGTSRRPTNRRSWCSRCGTSSAGSG